MVRESISQKIQFSKDSGLRIKKVREFRLPRKAYSKVNSIKTKGQKLDSSFGSMESTTLENGSTTKSTEKEYGGHQMEICTWANGTKEKYKALGLIFVNQGKSTKDFLKIF